MNATVKLVIVSIIAIISLFNSTFSVTKIVQVSDGRSMLDNDATAGIKLRKWFLILTCLANFCRVSTAVIEIIQSTRGVLRIDVIWTCELFPTIIFLCCSSFLTHYLGNIYYSLSGSRGHQFRIIWMMIMIVFLLTELACILMFSNVASATLLLLLHFVFIVFSIQIGIILLTVAYFTWSLWGSLNINKYNVSTGKVLARLILLVIALVSSLVISLTTFLIVYFFSPNDM
jgi:hypothetical protein